MHTDQEKQTGVYEDLSLLYAQYSDESFFNQTIFKLISKNFHTSLGLDDTINKYIHFKEINGFYFDIVTVDNRFGLEICEKILEINSSQKIIIKVRLDANQNLSKYHTSGFEDFIYEPFSKHSIEKSISNLMLKTHQKSITHNLTEKNKDLTFLLKECEERLYESEKKLEQRNEFFASMSHEIRTPMNAIIGMSQVLLDDKTIKREHLEDVKAINSSSNMLLGIINDILDFSKIEAGKVSLEKISFDLNLILNYLADMLKIKAQEKGLRLVFDIDHNIGKNYLGDSLRISQVLLNLLSNAIKFTDIGTIKLNIKTLNTVNEKSTIEFEVSDTGIGMTDEQLLNMFQSYSQATVETTRKYGGTGLGLSISKQLVEIMHGKIWLESELGKGTTFFVTLTLDTDSDKRKYRLPSKDIMQMKVIIIDSDSESLKSLKNLIKYFHMPVKTSSTIKGAKRLLKKDKCDILFIEKDMYDNLDIEAYKNKTQTHVVIIESWTDISKNKKIDFSVVDEILNKPFHQQIVYKTISNLYNIKGIPNNSHQVDKFNKQDIQKLKNHKILIAEDNLINQKVIKALLSDTNLEIEFANDGEEAIDILNQNKQNLHSLILMDINMPNLDGHMATQMIRSDSDYNDVVIVGLSGDASEDDLKKANEIGMQDYLTKPIEVKKLYEILIRYLSNY